MKQPISNFVLFALTSSWFPIVVAGPFAPAAGQPGSTAIAMPTDPNDTSVFIGWATGATIERGWVQINDPSQKYVSYGQPSDAEGFPQGDSTEGVVSLGDGGIAVLTFENPIANGPGYDFAIFENGFTVIAPNKMFLELAFVEVSSDGVHYERFPTVSLSQTKTQIPNLGAIDTTEIHNFAGKYRRGYGTPFDLEEIKNMNSLVNVTSITHVRLVDVVGTLQSEYASYDSVGNVINDPWPTNFPTGGFDLDAVGVIHEKTLEADIDGDGIVNLVDYVIFSQAWQTDSQNLRWNYKCDLEPFIDNVVSIDDFCVFTEQWLLTESWYSGVVYEKTLSGDINDDGIVNLIDYTAFSLAWLSNSESSEWNDRCNLGLSVDDFIDINDFLVMVSQWLNTETWYDK